MKQGPTLDLVIDERLRKRSYRWEQIMLAWHVPFLGWRRTPADLSEFEIAHFFTLKPIEILAVRSRYKETLRLGAALQLGIPEDVWPPAERASAGSDGSVASSG